MLRRDHLDLFRVHPSDEPGLHFEGGEERGGVITSGSLRSASGETFPLEGGYLDLLGKRTGNVNIANLSNYLPGAGRAYEPLWRVHSLSLLTGERFTNEREMEIVFQMAGLESGGTFLDLGCSSGLYTRNAAPRSGDSGSVVGVDLSPSMLREAARRSKTSGVAPSFVRADVGRLPFRGECFDGALCGGSLNEFKDPALALRESARVLRPGGRLAIMGILKARTASGKRSQRLFSAGGVRFFEVDEVKSLLDHSGFESRQVEVFGSVFFVGAQRR